MVVWYDVTSKLTGELRKLKQEVIECARLFDERLRVLAEQKMRADRGNYMDELVMVFLLNATCERQTQEEHTAMLDEKVSDLNALQLRQYTLAMALKREVADEARKLDSVQGEIRAVDRKDTFKRGFFGDHAAVLQYTLQQNNGQMPEQVLMLIDTLFRSYKLRVAPPAPAAAATSSEASTAPVSQDATEVAEAAAEATAGSAEHTALLNARAQLAVARRMSVLTQQVGTQLQSNQSIGPNGANMARRGSVRYPALDATSNSTTGLQGSGANHVTQSDAQNAFASLEDELRHEVHSTFGPLPDAKKPEECPVELWQWLNSKRLQRAELEIKVHVM